MVPLLLPQRNVFLFPWRWLGSAVYIEWVWSCKGVQIHEIISADIFVFNNSQSYGIYSNVETTKLIFYHHNDFHHSGEAGPTRLSFLLTHNFDYCNHYPDTLGTDIGFCAKMP